MKSETIFTKKYKTVTLWTKNEVMYVKLLWKVKDFYDFKIL